MLLKGCLSGQEVTLGSISAPNQGQLEILRELSLIIREVSTDKMIIGGDFNSVLDVVMDRSTPPLPSAPAHKIAKGLANWSAN